MSLKFSEIKLKKKIPQIKTNNLSKSSLNK